MASIAALRNWLRASAIAAACAAASVLPSHADPIKGVAELSKPGDYARLLIRLDEVVDADVKLNGSVLIVAFKKPVNVAVTRLTEQAPDYVAAVRRDPDGTAIRFALSRRIKVNTMSAGERLYVDLLPESWSGLPPSLPQDVVRELAERARAAEQALREQRQAETKKQAPVRVRASTQPTFARYVFEVPESMQVSSDLSRERLTLLFNAPVVFDLADARIIAPPNVAGIEQKNDKNSTAVELELVGDVNVHSFREDRGFVVDIGFSAAQKAANARNDAKLNALSSRPRPPAPEAAHGAEESKPAHAAPPATPAAATPPARPSTSSALPDPAAPPPVVIAGDAGAIAQIAKPLDESRPPIVPVKPEPTRAPESAPAKVETVAAGANAADTSKAEPAQPAAAPPPEAKAPPDHAPTQQAATEPAKDSAKEPAKGPALAVEVRRNSDGLRLIFPYRTPVATALFTRAESVWVIVENDMPLDFTAARAEAGSLLRDVTVQSLPEGQAVRLKLERPQLASFEQDDKGWVLTFAESAKAVSKQLTVLRNIADPSRANVSIPFERPARVHRLTDPDSGDPLLVVTAEGPPRGFIKPQRFVEFAVLASTHGVVIEPNSDDVGVELSGDKIAIGRPGGLTLSAAEMVADRAPQAIRPAFDLETWRDNVKADYADRLRTLMNAAAAANDDKRLAARLDLARFYFAKSLYAEAKGVLDVALSDMRPGQEDATTLVMRAVASLMLSRSAEALKDLAHPAIGSNYDSQLWKAIALARQEKWAEAREKFKNVEFSVSALPVELQRIAVIDAMRAMLAVRDFAGASSRLNELEVIGVPEDLRPGVAVLRGRLAEALGREADAALEYAEIIKSSDRQAAAEATLRDLAMRARRNEIKQDDLLAGLETLSVMWRGDGIEVATLQELSNLYVEFGRYREAMVAVRTATKLQPNSEISRRMQEAASGWFADIFLGVKGDDMPPVEALATFYEFRELTPIGRRGDEMIRRLADRLASIDLLDQASELLQYQVDHRLEGAARAHVAARLATFYLMNRKPERAVAALRSTRIADLAGELRQQRLLLEARAQSDIGRHDLALDIISNLVGRETIRLRSDIYWAARRWRESAEQIELLHGERWRDFQPLNAGEKSDLMRAAIGYALAEDTLGIARLREKYGPLMASDDDRKAFDVATRPVAATSSEYTSIARMAAAIDTLDGFLTEMKTRFPESTTKGPHPKESAKADPMATGSLPVIPGLKKVVAPR